jgi:hypothetical protein
MNAAMTRMAMAPMTNRPKHMVAGVFRVVAGEGSLCRRSGPVGEVTSGCGGSRALVGLEGRGLAGYRRTPTVPTVVHGCNCN